jgi:nucleotidyltransferase/DNA polymerase involved in DNA repair
MPVDKPMTPPSSAEGGTLPGVPPPDEPRPHWVVYVDLDAYYVSCELRTRPELVGRPVIVGPPPGDGPSRGVVLSASYEARQFGVRSALPAAVAVRMCPEATWIAPDFPKYERISQEVRSLLKRWSPNVTPYSIDEAAVLLEGGDASTARSTAERIQRALKEELGLPASIGVASTRLVAKIATDRAKPGGILLVSPNEVAAFVAPLPVRAIPGVGPKTEELLRGLGIETIGQLATRRAEELARTFGSFGRGMVALAKGQPIDEPETDSGPRSRSTDRTFERDVDRWEELESGIRELATDLGESLEREGLKYGAVGVGIRWADFSRSQHSRSLTGAQEVVEPLVVTALRLGRELWSNEQQGRRRPVRTISVRAERLSERAGRQASLDAFEGPRP